MNSPQPDHPHHKLTWFEVVILVLSLYAVFAIIFDTFFPLPKEVSKILEIVDTGICGIFLLDFGIRLHRAPDKGAFWKWGWIDLVASIPHVDFLRYGRLIRILRVIRLLRAVRSIHKVMTIVFENKIKSGFGSILLITSLLMVTSTVGILLCEQDPEANIKTAGDALWWCVTTLTTVGYGDKYPISAEGRIVAMVLMFGGVGLYGTLSGLLATYFLGLSGQSQSEFTELNKRVELVNQKLDMLLELKSRS